MGILDWFLVGRNSTHIHNFCILLDFLGVKDLKKNRKGQFFFKGHSQSHSFFYQNLKKNLRYVDSFDIRISSDKKNSENQS